MKRLKAGHVIIVPAISQPLSAVKNHADVKGLERLLFCSDILHKSAPAHIAVHLFNGRRKNNRPGTFDYTSLHAHSCWEVDLIIPDGRGFLFQLETDQGIQYIRSASTIMIPPGVKHRMEIVRGRGKMICIVFASHYAHSLVSSRPIDSRHGRGAKARAKVAPQR